jgi:RND family efflux transporter MFP subunit
MSRLGLLGSLVLLAASCGGEGDEAVATPRVPVGTAVAATDTLTEVVSVVGRLTAAPGGSALLTAPAPALVKRIPVQIGAVVRKGTLLVELEAPELTTNARSLAAQAEIAEREAARQQELLQQGITSQRTADEKAAEATGARSAAVAAAQLLARARITSPINGAVQRVLVHPGERVDAGASLVEVIDGSTLDLIAAVPAADLGRLKVGAVAAVLADGATESRAGTVQALAPAVDSLTNAGQAVIRIPNASHALRAGTGATALVAVGKRRDAVVVPDSAIVVVGDSMSVFVVEGDTMARVRSVTVGTRRGGRAEIKAGLKPGQIVVTSGAFGLTDGMRVVPSKAEKP